MPDQPAAPPPPFLTPIRLPPHQLELDEARFLRLLAGAVSLMKDEKRRIIEAVPRLSQSQADELMGTWEQEQADIVRSAARWPQDWEWIRQRKAAAWRELEQELSP